MDPKNSFEQKSNLVEQKSMHPTPINTSLALKTDGFSNLVDVLEYAAEG